MKKLIIIFVLFPFIFKYLCGQYLNSNLEIKIFLTNFTKNISIEYRVQLPENYTPESGPWPVLLYLHGAYNVKSPVSFNSVEEYEKYLKDRINILTQIGPDMNMLKRDKPFIVLSPVSPNNLPWFYDNIEATTIFLLDAVKTWNGDPDRIYITGPSGGAIGTWSLSIAHPELYAALLPMMGYSLSISEAAMVLTNIPVLAYCGAKDTLYRYEATEAQINAINNAGGNARLSLLADQGHGGWQIPWSKPETWDWLLQNKRKQQSFKGPELPEAITIKSDQAVIPGKYSPFIYTRNIKKEIKFQYQILLPAGYNEKETYPALFYFGGASSENEMKGNNPVQYARSHSSFPVIVFAVEQIRERWNYDLYDQTIIFYNTMISNYPIDKERVYTTGWGWGGKTAHILNYESFMYPSRIAAPVAATVLISTPATHGGFKKPKQPFLLYHGTSDQIYDFDEAVRIFGDTAPSADRKLFLIEGAGHDLRQKIYSEPYIYEWMLKYKAQPRFNFHQIINLQSRQVMPETIKVLGPYTNNLEKAINNYQTNIENSKIVKKQKIIGTHNRLFGYKMPVSGFNQDKGYYVFSLDLEVNKSDAAGEILFGYQGDQSSHIEIDGKEITGEDRKLDSSLYWEALNYAKYTRHRFKLKKGTYKIIAAIPLYANGYMNMRIETDDPQAIYLR